MRRRVAAHLIALAVAGPLLAGCGGEEDDYENRPRPPAPVTLTAAITDRGISVSPAELGAGPVELIVTNLTDEATDLTLETETIGGTAGGIDRSTGPINPGDTASLKADLERGAYSISVDGGAGTDLRVGSPRPSAQDELLQP